jgi:hypothetical protein
MVLGFIQQKYHCLESIHEQMFKIMFFLQSIQNKVRWQHLCRRSDSMQNDTLHNSTVTLLNTRHIFLLTVVLFIGMLSAFLLLC